MERKIGREWNFSKRIKKLLHKKCKPLREVHVTFYSRRRKTMLQINIRRENV